jgi:outer membrane protein
MASFWECATLLHSNALEGEGMKAFFWSSLVACLCFAVPAQAQYGNHRAGISMGAMNFNAKDVESVWGYVPLAIEYSLYVENSFDVGAQVPMVILFDTDNKRQSFAMGLNFNFRYLFMEEYIRPYVGAQLGGIYIFRRELGSVFIDIGPMVGVDFFISDAWSIGPRLFGTFHFMLNERVRYSVGGVFGVHTYF